LASIQNNADASPITPKIDDTLARLNRIKEPVSESPKAEIKDAQTDILANFFQNLGKKSTAGISSTSAGSPSEPSRKTNIAAELERIRNSMNK
jgi:hypothetical protein